MSRNGGLIEWCGQERARMLERAEQLERRKVTTREYLVGVGWHDISTAAAADLRNRIANLDALIAAHEGDDA